MECFSSVMESVCGCVIYYMPRLQQNTRTCSHADSKCYNPLRISIERSENSDYECSCLPACDELSYTGEVSTATLAKDHFAAKTVFSNFSTEAIMYTNCFKLIKHFKSMLIFKFALGMTFQFSKYFMKKISFGVI